MQTLLDASNRCREAHPLYRKIPIKIDEALHAELAEQGIGLDSIPPAGSVVRLGRIPKNSAGGSSPIRTDELSHKVRRVAVQVQQVQQVLQAPNTGIDLLVSDTGTPKERVVVLEANQCPFQTALMSPLEAAPGMGNHVPEALIDAYFPASRRAPRWPAASFDFVALREVLASAAVSSLALPRIQRGWQHQRMAFDPDGQQTLDIDERMRAMRRCGAVVQAMALADGRWLVDALGAPAVLTEAWRQWPGSAGDRCDP